MEAKQEPNTPQGKREIVLPLAATADMRILHDSIMIMPLRYAEYSEGKLGRWKYVFVERRRLYAQSIWVKRVLGRRYAVQVLFSDIVSLLWFLERRALYDPACLECLYPREWTDIYREYGNGLPQMPAYLTAVEMYMERTWNKNPCDNYEYDLTSDYKGTPTSVDTQVIHFLGQLDEAITDPDIMLDLCVDDSLDSTMSEGSLESIMCEGSSESTISEGSLESS
ncbi:hypothetical protein F5Y11DRAFT_27153 [Daldinia sp. FL1419]|nr:hypothetical protein F5Y11DRAFT_27153 [Daldinia sp. FL1419]